MKKLLTFALIASLAAPLAYAEPADATGGEVALQGAGAANADATAPEAPVVKHTKKHVAAKHGSKHAHKHKKSAAKTNQ